MKIHELIANLHDIDPDGESEVAGRSPSPTSGGLPRAAP
jgi:hypothetical protein